MPDIICDAENNVGWPFPTVRTSVVGQLSQLCEELPSTSVEACVEALQDASFMSAFIQQELGNDEAPAQPTRPKVRRATEADPNNPPFPNSIGIEFTMMPQCLSGRQDSTNLHRDRDMASSFSDIVEHLFAKQGMKCYSTGRRDGAPFADGRCVEAPSPVFKNMGDLKAWYDKAFDIMSSVGLKPHCDQLISGGGHIHVGGLSARVMANIMRDCQNKPWLSWTFNDPYDSSSSGTFTSDLSSIPEKVKEAAKKITVDPTLFMDDDEDGLSGNGQAALLFYADPQFVSNKWFPDDKSRMLRLKTSTKTFEFRFFDAPLNWEEQEAQIKFVQAYIKYIDEKYKKAHVQCEVDTAAKLKAFKYDDCRRMFCEFIAELGLPVEPYERMLDENLFVRFKKGKRE